MNLKQLLRFVQKVWWNKENCQDRNWKKHQIKFQTEKGVEYSINENIQINKGKKEIVIKLKEVEKPERKEV
jgi:hypothetical protein